MSETKTAADVLRSRAESLQEIGDFWRVEAPKLRASELRALGESPEAVQKRIDDLVDMATVAIPEPHLRVPPAPRPTPLEALEKELSDREAMLCRQAHNEAFVIARTFTAFRECVRSARRAAGEVL